MMEMALEVEGWVDWGREGYGGGRLLGGSLGCAWGRRWKQTSTLNDRRVACAWLETDGVLLVIITVVLVMVAVAVVERL